MHLNLYHHYDTLGLIFAPNTWQLLPSFEMLVYGTIKEVPEANSSLGRLRYNFSRRCRTMYMVIDWLWGTMKGNKTGLRCREGSGPTRLGRCLACASPSCCGLARRRVIVIHAKSGRCWRWCMSPPPPPPFGYLGRRSLSAPCFPSTPAPR